MAMTAAGAWLRAAERDLPFTDTPGLLLGPRGGALVLAPHPDDESLGCGGLLAACAAAGHAAQVVVLSDGAGSHPNSRSWPTPRLVALRQQEARAAIAVLGLDPVRDLQFLGLPDRELPAAGPGCLAAAEAILRTITVPPGAVFATWRHDPHADHAACHAIAAALLRMLPPGTRFFAYPVWGLAFAHRIPGFPLPPEPAIAGAPRGLRLDITPQLDAKRRAVAAHASQTSAMIDDDPEGFRLPPEALALAFRPFELFLEETAG